MKPKSQFEFVPRDTEESWFLDLVDFWNVAFSVEPVRHQMTMQVTFENKVSSLLIVLHSMTMELTFGNIFLLSEPLPRWCVAVCCSVLQCIALRWLFENILQRGGGSLRCRSISDGWGHARVCHHTLGRYGALSMCLCVYDCTYIRRNCTLLVFE